jgi:hypothetical protein
MTTAQQLPDIAPLVAAHRCESDALAPAYRRADGGALWRLPVAWPTPPTQVTLNKWFPT